MAAHQVFNIEDSWLPLTWAAAQTEERLFSNSRMDTVYATACSSYELCRAERSDQHMTEMEAAVTAYLEMASKEKELIRNMAWGGMGVTFVRMKKRSFMYYAIAIRALVFGMAGVGCEDFPGDIAKPWQVRVYDGLVEAILFGLIMWQAGPHHYPP